MSHHFRAGFELAQHLLHRLAFFTFMLLALSLVVATILSAIGYWPWLDLQINVGGQAVENAGIYVQVGGTILAVLLCFFLPSNRRIMALENSHRTFHMGVEDVARAYHHAHAADRNDVFQMSAEFDAMRERIAYLRDHPDMGQMEPEILEMAAQMSYVSRELAVTYSDENVNRARDFLRQRQHEVENFDKRLDRAKEIHQELKHWLTQVELEESVAASQLERLRDELFVILPEMGSEMLDARKIITLPRAAE
ncbi:DNA repair protein [Rhodobacteraceae bacterium D3-12]|nr:DNA repair protein [Rhodobacteraceae bacterium D3-12]